MEILIIGSGVHAIRSAFYYHRKEIKYVVYEKDKSIGGVFSDNFTYPNLKIHTNYSLFLKEFLPYYYPEWLKNIPDSRLPQKLVTKYLVGFVNEHNLNILVDHNVMDIKDTGKDVLVKFVNNNVKQEKKFKKVYLPIGYYRYTKPVNTDHLQVTSKHLYEIDTEYLKQIDKTKKIVVVGGGKGGVDLICELYKHGLLNNITWVIRTPRSFFLNSNTSFLFLKNLLPGNDLVTTPYYDKKLLTKDNLYLANVIPEEINTVNKLKKDQVIYGFGIKETQHQKIILTNNKEIECDYVFYCTGHPKTTKILSKNVGYIIPTAKCKYYPLLVDETKPYNFTDILGSYGKCSVLYRAELFALLIIFMLIIKRIYVKKILINDDALLLGVFILFVNARHNLFRQIRYYVN